MGYSTILAQIKATVEGVVSVGLVHDYQRMKINVADFILLFKSGGRINGCAISRIARPSWLRTAGEKEIAHIFRLRFYYSLKDSDASEKTFQGIIDSVCDAFDADETLSDTCDTTHPDWGPMNGASGLVVDVIDARMFGTVLCNFAEARICAIERKAI